jgi:hypothetical protein
MHVVETKQGGKVVCGFKDMEEVEDCAYKYDLEMRMVTYDNRYHGDRKYNDHGLYIGKGLDAYEFYSEDENEVCEESPQEYFENHIGAVTGLKDLDSVESYVENMRIICNWLEVREEGEVVIIHNDEYDHTEERFQAFREEDGVQFYIGVGLDWSDLDDDEEEKE